MCGILGIAARHGERVSVDERRLIAMRDAMQARGPDDAGLLVRENVAFAHRRLSIRDLSAGAQPWLSDDGRLALVYNGELYNDGELRRELERRGCRFRTSCDTETVLAAYSMWGADCVERFRGMFAFGVYDFHRRVLFLARDRFGVKPLFVTEAAGEFLFASSIAALLRHPAVSAEPNLPAISHYLSTFRLTLNRETVYRGIWQLRPAERLTLHNGRWTTDIYWKPPAEAITGGPGFQEAVDELQHRLADAVRVRLVSDVPLGLFVSGGVDSAAIARCARDAVSGDIPAACARTFSTDKQTDDWRHALRCAEHCDLQLQAVDVGADEYLAAWDELVTEYRTPVSTPSDVLLYRLAQSMKRRAGVVLGGEGADELLCGYETVVWSGREFDLLQELSCASASGDAAAGDSLERLQASLRRTYGRDAFASRADHYLTANCLIPTDIKPMFFLPSAWAELDGDRRMIEEYTRLLEQVPGESTPHRYAALLQSINLESLLSRLDSSTMLAGLEARVPYTDHLLVEAICRLPLSYKIAIRPGLSGTALSAAELQARGALDSKRLLRAVADRLLPAELARRPKASFPTAVERWIRGEWQGEIQRRLISSPFGRELFRPEALRELACNIPLAGIRLWPLLNVLAWGDREWGGQQGKGVARKAG